MKFPKALKVAEHGPKTEAQRQQAITALRSLARTLTTFGDDQIAKEVRAAIWKLVNLGDINLLRDRH